MMIDYFIRGADLNVHGDSIDLSTIMLLGSIPFIGLFLSGIYSGLLSFMIEEEYDQRKLQGQNNSQPRTDHEDHFRPVV